MTPLETKCRLRLRAPFAVAALATVCLATAPASPAAASPTQEALFQDDRLLLGRDLPTQRATLDEVAALGADTIHAIVYWQRTLADPEAAAQPAGDGADPGNAAYYSPAGWELLDSLVRETARRGIKLLLTPGASARTTDAGIGLPNWAVTGGGELDRADAGAFFAAVASRYNGTYPDENGDVLPRVRHWSFWNEPNQGGWIFPQYKSVGGYTIPYSPIVYRDLFARARDALERTGHRSGSKLYLGETAPLGDPKGAQGATKAMPPGLFLRELTCLDVKLRPYRGARAARRGCAGFAPLDPDGINHHFYTKGKGQPATFVPLNLDWQPIGAASRLVTLVDRIARARRWPKRLPIHNTEFGFQSNPPDAKSGVPLAEQAIEENVSEYLNYVQPRIRTFAHYLLEDDPCVVGPNRCLGFQTGLKLIDGSRKPAYDAYAMPLVVLRATRLDQVRVWGAARGRRAGETVEILRNGAPVRTFTTTNSRGYFEVTIPGAQSDDFQLRDPASGSLSRLASISAEIL